MAQYPATFYQEGDAIDYTPGSAVTAGNVVVIGQRVAVAPNDIAASVQGTLVFNGVWNLPKITGAIAVGDPIYWAPAGTPVTGDSASGAASATATGVYAGICTKAALSGDARVSVDLNVASRDEIPGASTAAAGSDTTNAGVLPAATSRFYLTSAADGTKGVRINAADQVTGRELFIHNGVSNAILKVYGPSGAAINGAAADAAFSSASGKGVWIKCINATANTWAAA
jgi:predicted RecA/RadA family phage recombinase